MPIDGRAAHDAGPNDFGLTPTEKKQVGLLVEGYSDAEGAVLLGVSESTFRSGIERILKTLHAENDFELLLIAVSHGLAITTASPPGTEGSSLAE